MITGEKKHSHRHSKGFSLIEVVVAVALFAMAAVVLSASFVNALLSRQHGQSNERRNADIQAVRMQLLLEPDLEAAEDGSTYETLNHGEAEWEATIEPTNVVDLFKVDWKLTFRDPPEGEFPEHSETLYLLRPTWSEADERSELLEDKKQDLENSRGFDRF